MKIKELSNHEKIKSFCGFFLFLQHFHGLLHIPEEHGSELNLLEQALLVGRWYGMQVEMADGEERPVEAQVMVGDVGTSRSEELKGRFIFKNIFCKFIDVTKL